MKQRVRILFIWVFISLISFVLSFVINKVEQDNYTINGIVKTVESDLSKRYDQAINDSKNNFFKDVIDNDISTPLPEYFLYIYKNDSLISWNSQLIAVPTRLLEDSFSNFKFKLTNNYYYVSCIFKDTQSNRKALVLLPIATNFNITTKYFNNKLLSFPAIGSKFSLTRAKQPLNSMGVSIKGGVHPIFYLSTEWGLQEDRVPSVWIQVFYISFLLALFISILKLIRITAFRFGWQRYNWLMLLIIIGIAIIVRLTWLSTLPFNLDNTKLFSPLLMSTNSILRSLGDTSIYTIFLSALLFYIHDDIKIFVSKQPRLKWFFNMKAIIIALVAYLMIYFISISTIQALVIDSKIPFDVYNFFNVSRYTFIGLGVLLIKVFNILILLNISLDVLSKVFSNKVIKYCFILFLLIICSLFKNRALPASELVIILILLLYTYTMNRLDFYFYRVLSGSISIFNNATYFWAIAICTSISIGLTYINYIKEKDTRLTTAHELVEKPELEVESSLSIIIDRLENDSILANYIINNKENNTKIQQYIIDKYLSNYFKYFNKKIIVYPNNQQHNHLAQNTNIKKSIVLSDSVIHHLDTLNKSTQRYPLFCFTTLVPIIKDKDTLAHLGIILSIEVQKTFENIHLNKHFLPNANPDYSYAYFYKNKLMYKSNRDELFYNNDNIGNIKDYVFKEHWNKSSLLYRISNDEILIINYHRNILYSFIATFSYFAIAKIFAYLIYLLIVHYIYSNKSFTIIDLFNNISLRNKVNIIILIIVFITLTTIAIFTISYLINKFKKNETYTLLNIAEVAQDSLIDNPYFINNFSSRSINNLQTLANKVSYIAMLDKLYISYYNIKGYKVGDNFDNANDSTSIMNPIALKILQTKKEHVCITYEYLGSLKYISLYQSVLNSNGEITGYMNIPYYATDEALGNEISNVLVTIINVYVFIFFLSGLVSFLLSRSLIKNFNLLINKFRNINVDKNESIVWPYNDEMKILVNEYNIMIHRVEFLASKLAYTERELAWRDVAKQIAHEIKNPLTPMKLKIQYLINNIKANRENVKELTISTSNILLEQIETLNSIATAFGEYAKLPSPIMNYHNLTALLPSIISLFDHDVEIITIIDDSCIDKNCVIYADKSFVNRILTNLISNATQSIIDKSEGLVTVSLSNDNDATIIKVKDNGRGIPNDLKEKIFVPYFTTKSSGSGIGLALSKNMMEMMGGAIGFESEENVGTTFFISFPYVKE